MNTIELTPEVIAAIGAALKEATKVMRGPHGLDVSSISISERGELSVMVWANNDHTLLRATSLPQLRAKVESELSRESIVAAKKAEAAKLLAEADAIEKAERERLTSAAL